MHQHIIIYCPTYLLLKPYINAGKVLKTFWELISYHLYNNESGRNYCFSYNTGKKMEALHVSSFFKVSTDNKWLESWGLNPGSPTPEPVLGHLEAAFSSSSLTVPPLLFSVSVVTAWASQPAHLPLGLCPPTAETREGSVTFSGQSQLSRFIQKLTSQSSETHNCKIIYDWLCTFISLRVW